MKRCVLAFAGVLLLFAAALRADDRMTFGGVVATIPDGWMQTGRDDTVVLAPSNLPAGSACTFTFLGGEDFSGSLGDRLASEWKEFEQLGRATVDDKGHIDGAGGPVELAGRAGVIELKAGGEAHVWLLIAGANHRIERMVFVTNSNESFAAYGPAITGMINGMKYVVPKPPEPLTGVCFGFAKVKTQAEFECWIFLPDGVVYTGFPIGGPASIDLDAERRHREKAFGVYRIEGKDVVVTMNKAKGPIRFTADRDRWAADVVRPFFDRRSGIHGNTIATWSDDVPTKLFIAKADPCDGMKLSASYRLDAAASSYAPRPIPSIQFTANGDFTEDGLINRIDPGGIRDGGGSTPSAMPADGGRGKYAIAGNTINLTYDNGAKLGLTLFITRADLDRSTPAAIYLHQSKLLLVP